MTRHHYLTDEILAERLWLYEHVQRDFPYGDDDAWAPDQKWYVQAAADARALFGRKREAGDLRQWWERPEKFSPYPDEVALDRAFRNFDPKVIENLSDYEWRLFIQMLDEDPDKPWLEAQPSRGMERHSHRPKGPMTRGHSASSTWLSERANAWYRLTEDQRDTIIQALHTRRDRLKRERDRAGRNV